MTRLLALLMRACGVVVTEHDHVPHPAGHLVLDEGVALVEPPTPIEAGRLWWATVANPGGIQ